MSVDLITSLASFTTPGKHTTGLSVSDFVVREHFASRQQIFLSLVFYRLNIL